MMLAAPTTSGASFSSDACLNRSLFQFGAINARLRTDAPEFEARFKRIFHDCLRNGHSASETASPDADLVVQSASASLPVRVEIPGWDSSDAEETLGSLFPELDLVPTGSGLPGNWRCFAQASRVSFPVVSVCGTTMLVDRSLPWQWLVAHCFLDHVMRIQRDYCFFHAATVAVGKKGVFIGGAKGAGKSTLSLALAARGHGFLGDEVAQLHGTTGTMLPFRRAVSIRTGPQASAVREFISRNQFDSETLPDGTQRLRLPVSWIFPESGSYPAQLTHAFFLSEKEPQCRASQFDFSLRDLKLIEPLRATIAGSTGPQLMLRFLGLFGGASCFRLAPGGSPDETAQTIETLVSK